MSKVKMPTKEELDEMRAHSQAVIISLDKERSNAGSILTAEACNRLQRRHEITIVLLDSYEAHGHG